MTLQEIFDQLAHGELSQLSIGGSEAGAINKANYGRLLSHVNLGLTALYKRFQLREGRVLVELIPNKTLYNIEAKFAKSNMDSEEMVRYLKDVHAPFKDDLLKIEQALTDSGRELTINNHRDPYTIGMAATKQILVPAAIVNKEQGLPSELQTAYIELVYRAGHPKLSLEDVGGPSYIDELEVLLPDTYMEALLYFVASRINNPIGMTNEFHAGNSYAAKYEQECAWLEMINLQLDQGQQSTRLRANGWV